MEFINDDRQREIKALEELLTLGRSNKGTQRCSSDDDDLGGLVGSMNKLSLELTKHENNKNSCITSNAISIDETSHIIETQCSSFSFLMVDMYTCLEKPCSVSMCIIQRIVFFCIAIFNYSIQLADLIDKVTIIRLPFVSIGRLLVYGYWYSLIYVTIKKYPGFGELLRNIFSNMINIINSVNTKETFGTPNYIVDDIINDAAVQGAINAVKDNASQAAKAIGDMVYTYMIDMAGKIPILLAIHQLLQLQKDNVEQIHDYLNKITYDQQQINNGVHKITDAQNNVMENNNENTNLMIQQFDELKKQITGLDKIYTDTNLYLQGIDATIQGTSERLGLQIQDVNIDQKNIIQKLNIQDTQTMTKLITELAFSGAPQIMEFAKAIGIPLPTGLLVNNHPTFPGGKKRSTRRKCKRSKVYKRGSSKKRGICKNTKKRVKSKKSKKSSKRRMKKTKRK